MPAVPFDSLPDDARLWVFAAADPLHAGSEVALLDAADAFLAGWAAHGASLRASRDWRDGRFLAIAVDQSTAGASGCSIDGLFRTLRALEPALGTSLLTAGRVYWRDADAQVHGGDRAALRSAAAAGRVGPDTPVFDTTVTTAGDWRTRFERALADSWHARIVGASASPSVAARGG